MVDLTGDNTYTGGTSIQDMATLAIGSDQALGNPDGAVTFTSTTFSIFTATARVRESGGLGLRKRFPRKARYFSSAACHNPFFFARARGTFAITPLAV